MQEIRTLSERIKSVSINDFPAFRREISEKTKVSRQKFYNWRHGVSEPSYSEGVIVDGLLKKYGYND